MNRQWLDPRQDPHWDDRLLRNGDFSFFHTSGWARVLGESYRYDPMYLMSGNGDRIDLLMPMMEVRSRLTGTRGVSLPYTDFCPLLVRDKGALPSAIQAVIDHGIERKWKYAEWRSPEPLGPEKPSWAVFTTHHIDLSPSEEALFAGLDDSNRRNIKKARKEGVVIRIDETGETLREFYRLNCLTRKRHGLPPQPYRFFASVHEHLLSKGFGIIVSALHEGRTIAASVFFQFGKRAIFKYGASEIRRQSVRPNNLVLWEALRWYRERGFESLHLGRTESDNPGLLRFKRAWGASESVLNYYRYDLRAKTFLPPHPPAARGEPRDSPECRWLFSVSREGFYTGTPASISR